MYLKPVGIEVGGGEVPTPPPGGKVAGESRPPPLNVGRGVPGPPPRPPP